MPLPHESKTTLLEHIVLGVLVTQQPYNVEQIRAAIERLHGDRFKLNTRKLQAILARLEARGLVTSSEP